MTVVAAYLYRDGKRVREVSIDEKIDCRRRQVRVRLDRHRRSDRARSCARCRPIYDLHPLAVEDALKADQLPKVDVYGDQLFVVARTAHLEDGVIAYGETAMFVGHSHIISVRHGSARTHRALRDQLEAAPHLLMHGVDYVLHAILDFIVDGYLPMVEAIEEEVLAMEHRRRSTTSSAARRSTASSPCAAS